MASNYRKLGDVIKLVDERNTDGNAEELLGVAIEKRFMPSVANVIGTDLSKYKLVSKDRFACNPMHVGRDEKLPIARYDADIPAIVSPAYFTFDVASDKVLPRYLELWFNRSEFDRRCWFATDASVRGGLSWDAMCDIPIDLPTVEEQGAVINRFDAIEARISQLRQLNDKLAAAGQAHFQEHFSCKNDEVPDCCELATVGDVAEITRGASPRPIDKFMSESGMPWVKISDASASGSRFLFSTAGYIIPEGVSKSRVIQPGTLIVSNSASPGTPVISDITACVHDGWLITGNYNGVTRQYLYHYFLDVKAQLVASSNGSVFNNLKTDIVKASPIAIPSEQTMAEATSYYMTLEKLIYANAREQLVLEEITQLYLARMGS